MISTSELESLRRSAESALPDTCSVLRNTPVSDGKGGFTDSWAVLATVACRVGRTGNQPQERAIADRFQATVAYTVTLPAETDVSVKDRITWGTRSLEVLGVMRPSQEITRRCVTSEVQQ